MDEWLEYVFAIVILRDPMYLQYIIFYLKSSVTSTLVINKSALQIFEYMVVVYRKIQERHVVFLHISNGRHRILVSYLFRFPENHVVLKKHS